MASPLSKHAAQVVESIAYKLHEVERMLDRLVDDPVEKAMLAELVDKLKGQLGGFFVVHMDRRQEAREGHTPEGDLKAYFGLPTSPRLEARTCPYCGSRDLNLRRLPGRDYLFCNTCRQESPLAAPEGARSLRGSGKGKGMP